MTLIKSVLGSLGIYYLSIFKAPESVVKSLESMRAAFFLGWRLFQNPSALWVQVIKSIHGEEAGVDLRGCQTNGVWASIVGTINHLHSSGIVPLSSIRFRVGDAFSIRFWKDTWLGNEPLCIRPLVTCRSKSEFDKLILDIANLDEDEMADSDSCIWSLSHDGIFSVNLVRKLIDDLSLPTISPSTRWYKMIPKNVNIFMWHMFLDRLPNRFNLSIRGLKLDSISCMACNGHAESNAHIFFKCDTALAVWHLVRSWTGSTLPLFCSCEDWDSWFNIWRASKDIKYRAYTIFAATCWTLWRYRKNITFNSHFMRKCDIFDFICLVSFS
nr:putative RNA-directed DNA polymerase, eukaryota, reverse transcriptase zinc-binding domain protein [Tanacetum cinerariifolium]